MEYTEKNPRRLSTAKLDKIHSDCLAAFDKIQSTLRDERMQCLEDRRFYSIAGAQWEGPLGAQFDNKPKLEVNKIALAVQRIFNEYRNNRIAVNFISKDGRKADPLAETCNKLYRSDEQDSCAEEAYDNAFEEAVGGGIGAWELCPEYEDEADEDNDKQRIRFKPIFDADSSVFFDLDAKRQDKSDAKLCFVLTSMSRDAYIEEFGDDPTSWPKEILKTEFDWSTPDVVYVARVYRVEQTFETVHIFRTLDDTEEKYTDEELDEEGFLAKLEAIGTRKVGQRKLKRRRVRLFIMSGGSILEDQGYIAGPNIPVVVVYGKRWFVDNVERCSGHVRLAKDAQRLANMQRSKLAEIAGHSSIEKPIFIPEQVDGHQQLWAEDNVKNYPYLLINSIMDKDGNMVPAGPAAYTKSPEIPPAMAALLQITEQDIKDVLGDQTQADKIMSNISGRVVELVQQRLDMQSYLYVSNFSKADRRSGEIWLGMAKELYNQPSRVMKGLNLQNEPDSIELLRPVIDEDTGDIKYENDLSNANLDVTADVGPSFKSQRAAIVRTLMELLGVTQDPETQTVLMSMAIMNMEGDGLRDVREFFRKKLVTMGVMPPSPEEAAAMEAAKNQPDPNAVFLEAAAEEAVAKAVKARADTLVSLAKAELTQAQTIETMGRVDATQIDSIVKAVNTLEPPEQPARPRL